MIYKEIDSKNNEINTLKDLLSKSQSEKQKALITKDLKALENGYKAEKDNAYYLDFHFKSKDNLVLLHDIRLEHNDRVAQFDHILIAPVGITVLESKSFTGKLTIKDDNSLNVKSGKYYNTFPNPIEQNNRHKKVLSDFINDNIELSTRFKLMGGIKIEDKVLIHPNTTVTNRKLPDGFERSDSFATKRNEAIDKMRAGEVFSKLTTLMGKDMIKEIAKKLAIAHKPVKFDYEQKYRISKSKNTEVFKEVEIVTTINADECKEEKVEIRKCPKCNDGELILRKRKNKQYDNKYKSDEFLGCSRFPQCRYVEDIV